jgi:dGTPase
VIRELIGAFVTDVIFTTSRILEENGIDSPEGVQTFKENVVRYSPEMGRKVRELKDFLYENMYRHYRLIRMQVKAERFVSELFQAYAHQPMMLPEETQNRLETAPSERVICDYIAGMTDRYALEEWEKLFDPYRKA